MGNVTITGIQDLTKLEADVSELESKLNGVIDQFRILTEEWTDDNKVLLNELRTQYNKAELDISSHATLINSLKTQYNFVQADMTTNRAAIQTLNTKYNNAKSDITELRNKVVTSTSLVNNLRTDLLEVQDLITKDEDSGTYSEPGSPSERGILAKIKRIEDKCMLILTYGLEYNSDDGYLHTRLSLNPGSASVTVDPNSSELSITSTSALTDPAGQTSTTVTDTTADQSTAGSGTAADTCQTVGQESADGSIATSNASVDASYSLDIATVVSIDSEVAQKRAKQLSRKTLNKLRN